LKGVLGRAKRRKVEKTVSRLPRAKLFSVEVRGSRFSLTVSQKGDYDAPDR